MYSLQAGHLVLAPGIFFNVAPQLGQTATLASTESVIGAIRSVSISVPSCPGTTLSCPKMPATLTCYQSADCILGDLWEALEPRASRQTRSATVNVEIPIQSLLAQLFEST